MSLVCIHAEGREVERLRRLINAHYGLPPEDASESLIAAAVIVIQELNLSIEKFYWASDTVPLEYAVYETNKE